MARHMPLSSLLCLLLCLVIGAVADCEPSIVFPAPKLRPGHPGLTKTLNAIEQKLDAVADKHNRSSIAIQLTTPEQNVWSYFRTAAVYNASSHRGVGHVNGDSVFRIASISKVFTVQALFQLQADGKLHLDEPVSQYLSNLKGTIPWHDITLRTLASQLSGIPRDMFQSDLIADPKTAKLFKLPPVKDKGLPTCDTFSGEGKFRACNETDFYQALENALPIFAPKQRSTYSNVAYAILGLVIANATGMSYSDYTQKEIFDNLKLDNTYLDTPPEKVAVIPDGPSHWAVELGIDRPTGGESPRNGTDIGIYTSANDMSEYMRYMLTNFNAISPSLNWLHPQSFGGSAHSSYGAPFEIFRYDHLVESSTRPVTFVTKSGGLPGYYSIVILSPMHEIGLTILVAGDVKLLNESFGAMIVPLIQAIDALAIEQLQPYAGTYALATGDFDSAEIELEVQPGHGLVLTRFDINSEPLFAALTIPRASIGSDSSRPLSATARVQLTPTLLFANETAKEGERWRFIVVDQDIGPRPAPLPGWCLTDVDQQHYATRAVNEFIFWRADASAGGPGDMGLELPAWRMTLRKAAPGSPSPHGSGTQAPLAPYEL